MTTQNIAILNTLPTFSGDPRDTELHFKSETDARTFMRSLENYFSCNNITEDDNKLQVMFSLVDKRKGDALDFISSYVGLAVSWEDVKNEFLLAYPSTTQELRLATKALLEVKVDEKHVFQSVTKLERTARAVTEAYLNNTGISQQKFNEDSSVANHVTDITDGTVKLTDTGLTLGAVVHNLLMHVVISATIHHKVYDKLAKIGPHKTSTRFRAEVVSAAARFNTRVQPKDTKHSDDHLWKMTQQRKTVPSDKSKDLECYTCGKKGHVKRDCPLCAFCKSSEHKVKECQERIKQAKGKYCHHCKIKDSHSTSECIKLKIAKRKKGGNVRMIQGEEHTESRQFDPTGYEDTESDSSEQ